MPYLVEDELLTDEPLSGLPGYSSTEYYYLDHIYTKDLNENYLIVQEWRNHIDAYSAARNDGVQRVMFTEAYANISRIMKYYESGSHVPFDFFLIKDANGVNLVSLDEASDVVDVIDKWMENMPSNATANWVVGVTRRCTYIRVASIVIFAVNLDSWEITTTVEWLQGTDRRKSMV